MSTDRNPNSNPNSDPKEGENMEQDPNTNPETPDTENKEGNVNPDTENKEQDPTPEVDYDAMIMDVVADSAKADEEMATVDGAIQEAALENDMEKVMELAAKRNDLTNRKEANAAKVKELTVQKNAPVVEGLRKELEAAIVKAVQESKIQEANVGVVVNALSLKQDFDEDGNELGTFTLTINPERTVAPAKRAVRRTGNTGGGKKEGSVGANDQVVYQGQTMTAREFIIKVTDDEWKRKHYMKADGSPTDEKRADGKRAMFSGAWTTWYNQLSKDKDVQPVA